MEIFKETLIIFFNILIYFILLLKKNKIIPTYKKKNKVFFGGARSGNVGGTLTKVKKLKDSFDESLFNFNIVYLLSNTPYLFQFNLNLINQLKIPIVHNQNGVFYQSWYKGDFIKKNKQITKQYNKANYIFFQSKFCREISFKYLGAPDCSYDVLYNAVDTSFFKPNLKQYSSNKFSFLITGKFGIHLKDSLILSIMGISECNKLGYNFELNIDGYLENKLINLIRELIHKLNLKNQIHINGKYTQEKANLVYNNNDAFIFLIYKAPCSNSVLEAMSSGLPVIYSDSGGTPEIVGDAGISLNVENSFEKYHVPKLEDITTGMIKIYKNHIIYSKNARNRAVNNFDIENWLNKHNELFNKLLNYGK